MAARPDYGLSADTPAFKPKALANVTLPVAAAAARSNVKIGPGNFKEHFDRDTIEYVSEDLRLSTLQRKLVRESNGQVAHALACQVKYFLQESLIEI